MAKPTKAELAGIRRRGIKAGFKGDRAAVMATWKRNQGKVRGKSAAAHAKAPGRIKMLPKPPEMSTQPVGNILRASAPGGKIATGPVQPVGNILRASAPGGKIATGPVQMGPAPTAINKVKVKVKAMSRGNSAAAHAQAPGQVKKLLAGVQTTKLPNPGKLGFSEKRSSITRVVMPKPRG